MNIVNMPGYGAVELRASYHRNLGLALAIALVLHLLVIGVYFILRSGDTGHVDPPLTPPIAFINEPLIVQPPSDQSPETTAGGGGGESGTAIDNSIIGGTSEVASNILLPNPDDTLPHSFASVENISGVLPVFGRNSGSGDSLLRQGFGRLGTSSGSGPAHIDPVREPAPDEFVDVQKLPVFDPSELQMNVKYPELARRNGIEGTVVVRVLIDRRGNAVRTMIDASDNVVLEGAAADAVMATTFTPALQNDLPAAVWMQVPVTFRLR